MSTKQASIQLSDWFSTSPSAFAAVAISFVAVYLSIIVLTRVAGLRSFSKMSAPDFAMTVAVGSLFASAIAAQSPPLPLAVFAMGCLFAGKWALAVLRRRSKIASDLLDNTPVLLMDGDAFQRENMAAANITEQDIIAKLREANVTDFAQIHAVVFETTGDISVLHGPSEKSGAKLDLRLLEGVRRQ
ncbi:MAG: YetF domain-containing protein [Planctomycetota bacterium]